MAAVMVALHGWRAVWGFDCISSNNLSVKYIYIYIHIHIYIVCVCVRACVRAFTYSECIEVGL
jgi:hypothetical protein